MERKNGLLLILILLCTSVTTVLCQDVRGVVTYQVTKDMGSMAIQTDGMSTEMKAQVTEMMKKRRQKEFVLKFNSNESSWQEVTVRQSPVKYINVKENLYLAETSVLGEVYLIKDSIQEFDWKLKDETKKIGAYEVKKAMTQRLIQRVSKNTDQVGKSTEIIVDTLSVEAWYAPDLPVSHGPEDHNGLPGLILELNDGKTIYLSTSVTINPSQNIEIIKPNSSKTVSRKQFNEIREAQRREVLKSFGGGN